MSREVRRVPIDWQHPMVWRERWDRDAWATRMKLVPRALFEDYPDALASWESERIKLSRREGFDWTFWSEYCLTGYKGQGDTEATIHPFDGDDGPVTIRDADHLHELLTTQHAAGRPDPDNYMPVFPEGTATGWCMYETTSEGTPISPVFETPEELARWLADTGASAFGGSTATYDQWLRMVLAGWAPSAVVIGDALQSGVAIHGGVDVNQRCETCGHTPASHGGWGGGVCAARTKGIPCQCVKYVEPPLWAASATPEQIAEALRSLPGGAA